MARKKKHPSFEIPEAVRHAGQAGWVYRTGKTAPKARRAAAKRAVVRIATPAVAAPPKAASQPAPRATSHISTDARSIAAMTSVNDVIETASDSRNSRPATARAKTSRSSRS